MFTKRIFIFSLPRSGSTLLQRYIMSCENIETTSETWLLLSLLYSIEVDGIKAEYNQRKLTEAVEDFFRYKKIEKKQYYESIIDFYFKLYNTQYISEENCSKIIVEKTPRLSLVSDKLIECSKNSHFVFLWRNPVDIINSMCETWAKGNWNIFHYYIDLYKSQKNNVETYLKYKNRSNVHSIKYEDFVSDENLREKLLDDIGLEYSELNINKAPLFGKMGDKTGIQKYKSISSPKKENKIGSILRYFWIKRYIRYLKEIGFDDIYDTGEIIKSYKISWRIDVLIKDVFSFSYGYIYLATEPRVYLEKLKGRKGILG
ncbi:hypothetical protein AltI4_33560 [Alteromonas sp. I4]|nr:hypothetical protein AltI4_33560 [Alteromonas sp. I4]